MISGIIQWKPVLLEEKRNQSRNNILVVWLIPNWISDYPGMESCVDFRQVPIFIISLRLIIVGEVGKSNLCFLANAWSTSLQCCLRAGAHMPLSFHKLGTVMTYRGGRYNEGHSLFQSYTHTFLQMIIFIYKYTHTCP